jgi:hypothetical protein
MGFLQRTTLFNIGLLAVCVLGFLLIVQSTRGCVAEPIHVLLYLLRG